MGREFTRQSGARFRVWLGLASLAFSLAVPGRAGEEGRELPEAVGKALGEACPGAKLIVARPKTVNGLEAYEIKLVGPGLKHKPNKNENDVREDGVDFKIILTTDGTLLEEEEHLWEGKVPVLVQRAADVWAANLKGQRIWYVSKGSSNLRRFELFVRLVTAGHESSPSGMDEENQFTLYRAAIDVSGKVLKADKVEKGAQAKAEAPPVQPVTPPAATEPPAAQEPKKDEIDPDVLNKVRKLIRGTLKEDQTERETAWKELREMGNLAVPGLLGLYRQGKPTPEMVRSILLALGDSKDPRAGAALVELLDDGDPLIRRDAARAVGDSNYKAGAQALKKHFQDEKETEEVRLFAAASAAKLGSGEACEALQALLKAPAAQVRARAVYALGRHGGAAQLASVAAALSDTDTAVRENAVEALRTIEDPAAVAPLVEATKDVDYKVRGAAMDALRARTGQKFDTPEAWQAWRAKESGQVPPGDGKKPAAPDVEKPKE